MSNAMARARAATSFISLRFSGTSGGHTDCGDDPPNFRTEREYRDNSSQVHTESVHIRR